MLTHLCIRNFLLIEALELSITQGLTVMTGESGAGKSIILNAIQFALGGKSDSRFIRHGQTSLEVALTFEIQNSPQVETHLNQLELASEEGLVIIRRTLQANGTSRAFINGTPVTLKDLKTIAGFLLQLYGQHQHHGLLESHIQREYVDALGKHDAQLSELKQVVQAYQAHLQKLTQLTASESTLAQERALLEYQLAEFAAVDLKEHEFEQLEEEYATLQHGEKFKIQVMQALNWLRDNESHNAQTQLHRALQALETIPLQALESIKPLLQQAQILCDEASSNLQDLLESMDDNPERLAFLEKRLDTLHDLAKKHQIKPSKLFALTNQLAQKQVNLEANTALCETLQQECDALLERYQQIAAALTTLRTQAAGKLNKAVNELLGALNFHGSIFKAVLMPTQSEMPSAFGLEIVEFQLQHTATQPFLPIQKIASGGELSRLCLALLTANAHAHTWPTLIFDEIDAGLSGSAALMVGKLLKTLSQGAQVLVVTHLPQVAAQGTQHWQVCKKHKGDSIFTEVRNLAPTERTQEIARLVGGNTITEKTLANAEELLAE